MFTSLSFDTKKNHGLFVMLESSGKISHTFYYFLALRRYAQNVLNEHLSEHPHSFTCFIRLLKKDSVVLVHKFQNNSLTYHMVHVSK